MARVSNKNKRKAVEAYLFDKLYYFKNGRIDWKRSVLSDGSNRKNICANLKINKRDLDRWSIEFLDRGEDGLTDSIAVGDISAPLNALRQKVWVRFLLAELSAHTTADALYKLGLVTNKFDNRTSSLSDLRHL